MENRRLGSTGLVVSPLGLGGGQVGEASVDEAAAGRLLNGALDAGVRLIDSARGYGLSEERIGRHLARRRDEFVLCTKGGYGVDGVPDWTPAAVRRGVERALRLLRTDRLDIFLLHSCPAEVLRRGDLADAIDDLVAGGLIGVGGYSGDNEPLVVAADSGRFGVLETSVSLTDQWSLRNVLPQHPALGVLAKRSVANAPWRFAERPTGQYAELYWDRLHTLALDPGGLDWAEFAIRFTAYAPGVDCALTGTASLDHLQRNLAYVERGPLPPDLLASIEAAWQRHGLAWAGSV